MSIMPWSRAGRQTKPFLQEVRFSIMAAKKRAVLGDGFAVFNKPGAAGAKERIAIDLASGVAVETAGKEFYIYSGGHRHIVAAGELKLEDLLDIEVEPPPAKE